jgi:hypothetical protein
MMPDEPVEDSIQQQRVGLGIEISEKVAFPAIAGGNKGVGIPIREDDRVNAILSKSGNPYLIPLQWDKQWADANKPHKVANKVKSKERDDKNKEKEMIHDIEKKKKKSVDKAKETKTAYPNEMLYNAKAALSPGRLLSESVSHRKAALSANLESTNTSQPLPSSSHNNKNDLLDSHTPAENSSKRVKSASAKRVNHGLNPLAVTNTHRFVAEKLFKTVDLSSLSPSSSPLVSNSSSSALDKLSFAERLQVMMMQIKDQDI